MHGVQRMHLIINGILFSPLSIRLYYRGNQYYFYPAKLSSHINKVARAQAASLGLTLDEDGDLQLHPPHPRPQPLLATESRGPRELLRLSVTQRQPG